MPKEYDKQGYLIGSQGKKHKTLHSVRVMLDDHDHKCLLSEAVQNFRVPSRELSHQISERYKGKQVKGDI